MFEAVRVNSYSITCALRRAGNGYAFAPSGTLRYGHGMRILLLAVLPVVLCLSGCASRKPKSATRIYEGDAPSIRYSGEETAGGRLETL